MTCDVLKTGRWKQLEEWRKCWISHTTWPHDEITFITIWTFGISLTCGLGLSVATCNRHNTTIKLSHSPSRPITHLEVVYEAWQNRIRHSHMLAATKAAVSTRKLKITRKWFHRKNTSGRSWLITAKFFVLSARQIGTTGSANDDAIFCEWLHQCALTQSESLNPLFWLQQGKRFRAIKNWWSCIIKRWNWRRMDRLEVKLRLRWDEISRLFNI